MPELQNAVSADVDWLGSEAARAALDAVPRNILIFAADGSLLFANAAARPLFSEFPVLIDPASERPLPPERSPLTRALNGESIENEEYIVRRPREGGPQWFECCARPICAPAGNIAGVLFSFANITERKKKELSDESAAQLRDFIYHENLAGILHATIDGRIIDCNDAILRMWGYTSRQELAGLRMPQLYFDPLERDRMLRMLASERSVNEFEICYRRRNGSRCWVLLNARLLDPPAGQVGGTIVSTVIDITDRRIQEETLRQSEQRFSAFMRHLPGVAFIKDLAGRYIYYNEASWTHFRMRPADILGKTDEQIWPVDNADRYRRNDAAVIEGKRPIEFVEPVTHPDSVHSWLIYKFPIIEEGEVTFVGGIGVDITERRILEEQLTQSRKMEALGRLAGGVAHDFNNLLTVISGYGQMALEGAGSVSIQKMVMWLQEILNSSRRAAGLTNQLLSFSRRQAIQSKVMNLGDLLHAMQKLLQRVIGEHVELKVEFGEVPCLILADSNQIEQVVMNLAVNARDAMPLGGKLHIHCEKLQTPIQPPPIDDETPDPFGILLEVSDTGVGMDETIRPKIFDPFFTSKEKGKGTGLGLSTVYGIVSQAKGKIEVESVLSKGTVFRIYFPEASGELEAPAPAGKPSSPKGRETVLLVEDEDSVRALAEAVLKRLGYKVLIANSGQAALTIWEGRAGRVDVLLTDVIMPLMSGGELAHTLREKKPGLKVLFMSGYTDDMLAGHGVLTRETQLIQKPFTSESLARKLRDVLDA